MRSEVAQALVRSVALAVPDLSAGWTVGFEFVRIYI